MKKMKLITGLIIMGLVINFSALLSQEKVEKSSEETFSVQEGYLLDVASKFGDVDISNWDNDEVKIVVEIWVESKKKDKAEELLEKLDVELSQTGNTVSVKTVLPSKMNTGKDTKFEINIIVQAPLYSNININAKYSNVFIEGSSGHTMIDMAYSNFNIGSLTRGKETPLNEFNLAYSDGNLEQGNWLKMDLAYSKINIEEATSVVLDSRYSGVVIEECNSVIVNSKYDKFQIEELNNFNGILKYSSTKISELESKLEIESAYSSFSIGEMGADFELIKIDNKYGGIKINLNQNSSFTINATASSGSVSIPNIDITTEKKDGQDKFFEGTYGSNPQSKIDVDTRIGSVKFSFD
ncbi:MAG: DUF4097 family beta strand repeat protein [Bacteroidales bacterium]|nr:DUF4097 family beta strand repeat protein [Bacteroidales bacterium]